MTPSFKPSEISLTELPNSTFKELADKELTFVDSDGAQWTAPLGTWTDGASVPRLALGVTDGRFEKMFLKAAVVHDAYCQKENKDRRPPYRSRTWRETHKMFHEACLAGGTPRLRARLMFSAVSWFGPRWDDPEAEARQVPADLARVAFSATKEWVEKEEPSLADIEADVEEREPVIMEVYRLQSEALDALNQGDRREAEAKLRAAEALLAAGFKGSADDLMFLNLQAYQHKNWAMLRPDQREEELNKAEELFKRVLAAEERDASAWNGLGSVAILRDDLDKAEELIHKALQYEPDYRAAKHDLRLIERIRASRSSQ